jgi:methionyl-tRNA synthetase
MPEEKILITAALPYANGPLHIGHLAGAYLPADTYARYLRLKGKKVLFVCGSDEHGAAITLRAKKDHASPQEIVDRYHELNRETFDKFGMSFDIYHRTSDPIHHETARQFFLQLYNNGEFVEKNSEQFYDEEYDQFLADRYISGQCPKCGNPSAYGDQCEKCGSSLNPSDLINPISTLSGKPPVLKETKHWYLPMGKHEAWLKEWIKEGKLEKQAHHNPTQWRKPVIGQCMSWIEGGLQDRAMTRDLEWGVKVPLKDTEGKVLYVWLDAPIGYISATKAWAMEKGEKWEDYWKDPSTKLYHFIGKDNIVFHCIIFPIILKTHGEYILPHNVPANEFLNLEGDKISTSRDWAVWLHQYIEDLPQRLDELRYVLTSIAPETKDSEFTWDDFQARINNELVAIYGNFVNRTLVLTRNYFEGEVPSPSQVYPLASYQEELSTLSTEYHQKFQKFQFREALTIAMQIARLGNRFLAESEPWKLIKTDEKQVSDIIHFSLQLTANAALAFLPFLPETSSKLMDHLGLSADDFGALGNTDLLKEGEKIGEPFHLFTKLEDSVVEAQKEKLKKPQQKPATKMEPIKENIAFEDFLKLDLRIAEIKEAETVPKSNKLLKLIVLMGNEERTILSGIAKHYQPRDLIGKKVQVIANLPPRKMMGIESQGMLLMAENSEGELSIIGPDRAGKIEAGATVS